MTSVSLDFHDVLATFKKSLLPSEEANFKFGSLVEVEKEIKRIQTEHAPTRKLKDMKRLEKFLEAMKDFDRVVQVFLNTSEILAFVWGPMKFLLQVASNVVDAFNTLLEAYKEIGENLPLLSQYQVSFNEHPEMKVVLKLVYEDVLEFHREALRHFRHSRWREIIHATWKTFNTKFDGILKNLHRHSELLQRQASQIHLEESRQAREEARIAFKLLEQAEIRRQMVLVQEWLSAAEVEVDLEKHALVRAENPGSGGWLLQHTIFQSWFDLTACTNPLLWLSGIPGAGKTVLASMVVQESLKLQGVTTIYFFFKYADPQRSTFLAVLKGLLSQLLRHNTLLLPYMLERASGSGSYTLNVVSIAKELLLMALRDPTMSKVYIILDGIDECDRDYRREITKFFQDTVEALPLPEADHIRCLFVSQDDGIARKDLSAVSKLKISMRDNAPDIANFSGLWSIKIQQKFSLCLTEKDEIVKLVTKGAEGMFLYAKLVLTNLHDQNSKGRLKEELKPGRFPKGLHQAYSRIVDRILHGAPTSQKEDVTKLLGWLSCSKRPMRWYEIQGVTCIDLTMGTVNWADHELVVDGKDICGSLIEIRPDHTVELVHKTAKAYLLGEKIIQLGSEETRLAELLIAYLSFPGVSTKLPLENIQNYALEGYYAALDYSVAHWSHHLEACAINNQDPASLAYLTNILDDFLDSHWKSEADASVVPRTVAEKLHKLQMYERIDDVNTAVYMARKQSKASSISHSEDVLDLLDTVQSIRKVLERLITSSTDTAQSAMLEKFYGKRLFKCPRLGCYHFYHGFEKEEHRKAHEQKHERAFLCTFEGCPDLGFPTARDLEKHRANYHGDEEEELEFPEASGLSQDQDATGLQCYRCMKHFSRRYNLKQHLRTHSGDRPFKCGTCDQSFGKDSDRKRHELSVHDKAINFRCGPSSKEEAEWGCGWRCYDPHDYIAHLNDGCAEQLLEDDDDPLELEPSRKQARHNYDAAPTMTASSPECNDSVVNGRTSQHNDEHTHHNKTYAFNFPREHFLYIPRCLVAKYPILGTMTQVNVRNYYSHQKWPRPPETYYKKRT